ncbi:hypothetical protein C0J50_10558 [Silurus asotus]|uniref:SCAN box domain-containing protein n=1 Tax=Silurus asotus TaxID=30991 RepID=A0AAD5B5B4_SILAS|nr:hypothetical protein C0J50_10558 [Silurus asotus]
MTEPSPLAELVKAIAELQQTQHQALLQVRAEQEQWFEEVIRAQAEDRAAFRSALSSKEAPVNSPPRPPPSIPLIKMGTQDDVKAFLELFERIAVAGEWTGMERALRLLPLLSGEAQLAVQQLPADRMLEYDDLKQAILQRVGRTPEQHRQRFRALTLREVGRPFAFAHQLHDACRRWLRDKDRSPDEVLDRVVLEQFIAHLPPRTAEWVQCQRPETVEKVVQLAEDHLAEYAGPGLPWVSGRISFFPLPWLFFLSSHSLTPEAGADSPEAGGSAATSSLFLCLFLSFCFRSRIFAFDSTGGGDSPRRCGVEAWAGLLALRGAGAFPGSVSCHGVGGYGPDSRGATGCP